MQQLFLYIDAHILLLRDIESAGETNTQAFTVVDDYSLFLRLRSVAAGIRTPNLPLAIS